MKKYMIFIGLIIPMALSAQWNQLGSEVLGEAPGQALGQTLDISSDGLTMVVGAHITSNFEGRVRVFNHTAGGWVQRGGNIDGSTAQIQLGACVSINDNGLVIAAGANRDINSAGLTSGSVSVYEWDGSAWIQRGSKIEGDGNPSGSFGSNLKLNAAGDVLVVSDSQTNFGGKVRVFQWNGSAWSQRGSAIVGSSAPAAANFGNEVGINDLGDVIVIGAHTDAANGLRAGAALVYEWDGTNWVQRGTDIGGLLPEEEFGYSVSCNGSGDVVAIGGPQVNSSNSTTGLARVYEWNGASWIQRGTDFIGLLGGERFGRWVRLSNDGLTVAVSATHYGTASVTNHGRVKVYQWDGTTWNQTGTSIDGLAEGDKSGKGMALSNDGGTFAIGAHNNTNVNGLSSGHIRVFQNSTSLGLNEAATNSFAIYPNPSAGSIVINMDQKESGEITLFTTQGKQLQSLSVNNGQQVNLSELPAGVYFYLLTVDGARATGKLLLH